LGRCFWNQIRFVVTLSKRDHAARSVVASRAARSESEGDLPGSPKRRKRFPVISIDFATDLIQCNGFALQQSLRDRAKCILLSDVEIAVGLIVIDSVTDYRAYQ
jgi:hypothetical protein